MSTENPFAGWLPPATINIRGHDYKVKFVGQKTLGKDLTGKMIHPKRAIHLLKTLKDESLFLTFFHEVRHAQHYENGDTQTMSDSEQEADCERYASDLSSLKKQGAL